MKARLICFEGTEGVGKTTQTVGLALYLKQKGYKVLQTKEPGISLLPLTMELRKIMLDAQYEDQLSPKARELICQAIRSIHLEKLIKPALSEYDFIIQDRGILSSFSYGEACGHGINWLSSVTAGIYSDAFGNNEYHTLYDDIIYLTGDISKGLELAKKSKQEFEAGDAIEAKGNLFMERVSNNMMSMLEQFSANKYIIDVDNKNIDQVFDEILNKLKLR